MYLLSQGSLVNHTFNEQSLFSKIKVNEKRHYFTFVLLMTDLRQENFHCFFIPSVVLLSFEVYEDNSALNFG